MRSSNSSPTQTADGVAASVPSPRETLLGLGGRRSAAELQRQAKHSQEKELLRQARSREEKARDLSHESKELFKEATGLRKRALKLKKELQAPSPVDRTDSPEEDPLLDDEVLEGLGGRLGFVPLMGEEILIDDSNAALVLVFTKCTEQGGVVDPEEEIKDPLDACKRIFERQSNSDSITTINSMFDCFDLDYVNAALYHEVVRAKVLRVLQSSGIRAETFESIDGDETFVKLSLARDGEVIKTLAQRNQYRLPFRAEAYRDMPPSGSYEGGRPMRNSTGKLVPAYAEFEFELQDYLEPFRQVDEVRLLQTRLDEWMNLEEMVKQNVLSRYFVAANYKKAIHLHQTWGSLHKLFHLPTTSDLDEIKDYFGEAMAFFFRWYSFYVRMLLPLALVGFICTFRDWEFFKLNLEEQEYFQYVFGVFLVVWATVFNELFKNRAARLQQRWGMKDNDEMTLELSSYDPALEGTWRLAFRKLFSKLSTVLFCAGFVAFVLLVQFRKAMKMRANGQWPLLPHETKDAHGQRHTGHFLGGWENNPLVLSLMIKAFSFLWRYVAPWLVNLQNHRTIARWNDALTVYLASVKLFVALFPFLDIAFFKKYKHQTCADEKMPGLAGAAFRLYGHYNWPMNLPKPTWNGTHWGQLPGPHTLEELLDGFYHQTHRGEYCIYGCYPVKCSDRISVGGKFCVTNCDIELEGGLYTFYWTHVFFSVLYLVIPIFLTRWEVQKEYDKVNQQAKEGEAVYSFMQFQAKCHEMASYEYNSWGGSHCEDFLERAISYALLTCFGIHKPLMAVVAFCSSMVEYRLTAYRMANLTCRPMPIGAEGIGVWQEFFEGISFVAVATNVAMAVFVMYPIRMWSWGHQFMAFVVLEHAMLFLRIAVDAAIPDEPEDVQRVQDFNVRFKRKFVKYDQLHVPKHEWHCMANVDIGLGCSWL